MVEIFRAKNIPIPFQRLETELIPLGTKQVEVLLGEIELHNLRLDPANPRIQFQLEAEGLGSNVSQEKLRNLLWDDPEVKALKRDIQLKGGLMEAIIVSGNGTTFEGNSRFTCYLKLHEEFPDDPRWKKIRARILPTEVTRETVDELLGELHIVGKNKWTTFEQAAHLFRMAEKGYRQEVLAQIYRMSKSYVSNRLQAYRLMRTYIDKCQQMGKVVPRIQEKWSWFEEFYKKCKPGAKAPGRIYNGPELEQKFLEWMLNDQLPHAEDVRRLYECLEDRKAIAVLDKGEKIDKAYRQAALSRPELTSKIWKEVEALTEMLAHTPLSELEALREGDDAKTKMILDLNAAIKRLMSEAKLKA